MKRIYRLPIMGGVKSKKPLRGVEGNPLANVPIEKLPGFADLPNRGFNLFNLEYNIDKGWSEVEIEACEVLHDWLTALMPQLKDIAKSKGWKLDKTKLVKK